jgi:hypothetical protein
LVGAADEDWAAIGGESEMVGEHDVQIQNF